MSEPRTIKQWLHELREANNQPAIICSIQQQARLAALTDASEAVQDTALSGGKFEDALNAIQALKRKTDANG